MSVIVPAHNCERFVEDAVSSVLAQTFTSLECIVVDDGSVDATASVARRVDPTVRVVSTPNQGVAAARNRGVGEAKGDLVAFLDGDDVWLEDKLTRQVSELERIGAAFVYSGMYRTDQALQGREVMSAPSVDEALINTMLLRQPSIYLSQTGLVSKAALVAIGGFDERLSTAADYDLSCRLAARVPLGVVDEPLAFYRQHDAQMHHSGAAMGRDVLLSLESFFSDPHAVPESVKGVRREATARLHFTLMLDAAEHGRWGRGVAHAIRGSLARPATMGSMLSQRLSRR